MGAPFKAIDQFDLEGNFIKRWTSLQEAAASIDRHPTAIGAVINGRQKSAGGFIWKASATPNQLSIPTYTEEQTDLFTTLIRKNTEKINYVISRYSFAKYYDGKSELFQMVLINAWRGFEKWYARQHELEFGAWIFTVANTTCLKFHRDRGHVYTDTSYKEELPDVPDHDSYVEKEALFSTMESLISDLPDKDRRVIDAFLTLKTGAERADLVGLTYKHYSVELSRVCKSMRTKASAMAFS